jgi:hypothetical protein
MVAHVCVETTGASIDILAGLLALAPAADTLKVLVRAPFDLCLRRIGARASTGQIPMDEEGVRRVHQLSLSSALMALVMVGAG